MSTGLGHCGRSEMECLPSAVQLMDGTGVCYPEINALSYDTVKRPTPWAS